jgi:hypothetical protein
MMLKGSGRSRGKLRHACRNTRISRYCLRVTGLHITALDHGARLEVLFQSSFFHLLKFAGKSVKLYGDFRVVSRDIFAG